MSGKKVKKVEIWDMLGAGLGAAAITPGIIKLGAEVIGCAQAGIGANNYYRALAWQLGVAGFVGRAITAGEESQPCCVQLIKGLLSSAVSFGMIAVSTELTNPDSGLGLKDTFLSELAGAGVIVAPFLALACCITTCAAAKAGAAEGLTGDELGELEAQSEQAETAFQDLSNVEQKQAVELLGTALSKLE